VPPFVLRRDTAVVVAKVLYLQHLLSCCQSGLSADCEYEGDEIAGRFLQHDGQGNHVAVFWDAIGVIVFYFESDWGHEEYVLARTDRRPRRCLIALPPELEPLASRACRSGERLATRGFWAIEPRTYDEGTQGSWLLEVFAQEIDLDGLGAELVPRLAMESSRGRSTLSVEEGAALLEHRPGARAIGDLAIRKVIRAFAKVGVDWPTGRAQAAALRRAEIRERRAARTARFATHGAHEQDLLRGAHDGSLDAVRAALEAGANIDGAVVEGQIPLVDEGATALMIAIERGHEAVAHFLLERGASPNRASRPRGSYPCTALGLAAQRGAAQLCEALLARGATVGLEASGWRAVLEQVAVGWHSQHLPRDHADHAETIRVLRAHGAPMPPHATSLYEIVEAAGKPEILEDLGAFSVAPPMRPPIDVTPLLKESRGDSTTALRAASRALRGPEPSAAIAPLIDAWRSTRSPRIASLAETLSDRWLATEPHAHGGESEWGGPSDLEWEKRFLTGDDLDRTDLLRCLRAPTDTRLRLDGEVTERRLRALAVAPPDPRASREIVAWLMLSEGNAPRDGRVRCEVAAADALRHQGDVRFVEGLSDCCKVRANRPADPGRMALVAALAALESAPPDGLSEVDAGLVSELEDLVTGRGHQPSERAIYDLFQDVYANPEDDEPRRRLGERLEAAGDPRGELIRLQLDRHGKKARPSKRESELLRVHARRWLGPLSSLVDDTARFERGFVVEARTGKSEHAGSTPHARRRALAIGRAAADEWRTVERLSLLGEQREVLVAPGRNHRALRELTDVGPWSLGQIVKGPQLGIEVFELVDTPPLHSPPLRPRELVMQLPAVLPVASTVALRGVAFEEDLFDELLGAWPSLRDVSLNVLEARRWVPLVAVARSRGIRTLRLGGWADVALDLDSNDLEIELYVALRPGGSERAIEVLRALRRTPPARVHVRAPMRIQAFDVETFAKRLGIPCTVVATK